MTKFILQLGNNCVCLALSSIFGGAAIAYINANIAEVIGWLFPVFFIVAADLGAGVRAARYRGDNVRFSTACRRTLNKLFCYGCWIFTCVALNERYETEWCAWVGMGIVFLIEGLSFVTNVLEPRGIRLSITGLLKFIGRKIFKTEGLEEVIEKKEK